MPPRRDRAVRALPKAIEDAIAEVDANPDPEDAWRQAEIIREEYESLKVRAGALRARVTARWWEAEQAKAEADGSVFHLADLGKKMAVSSTREQFIKARVQQLVKAGKEQIGNGALPRDDGQETGA
jgi:hypothetical protein